MVEVVSVLRTIEKDSLQSDLVEDVPSTPTPWVIGWTIEFHPVPEYKKRSDVAVEFYVLNKLVSFYTYLEPE